MVSYILRRILSTLPVMGIVALFVFSLLYIAPGDPAAVIAGDQASPADVERIRQGLGLDRPFLVQFGTWLWNILHGDLGTSIFTNLPVSAMIAQRIEPTLSLMALELSSVAVSNREAASIISIFIIALTISGALLVRYFGRHLGVRHEMQSDAVVRA